MAELNTGVSFLVAFFCTFLLVPLCKKLAIALRCIDVPDGKIKIHTSPIPYWGGCAVYIGFIVPFFLLISHSLFLFLLVGLTLLLLVGLIDDYMTLLPQQKFFGQVVGALFCLTMLFYHKTLFPPGLYFLSYLFWVLAIINAFNLIDVMDGLATAQAVFVATMFLIYALYTNSLVEATILSAFLGTLVAFFLYNSPPASIYLGDAGALYIGGFLAFTPFLFEWGTGDIYKDFFLIPLFAVPLLELVALIVIRTYKGIPFYKGSLDHFAIYFIKSGWSKWRILVHVSTINSVFGLIFFVSIVNNMAVQHVMIACFTMVVVWFFALYKALYKKNRGF